MCKDSLKDLKCFNQDCELWHFRGTIKKKRSEINAEQASSAAPERAPAPPSKKPTSKNSKEQASKDETSTSSLSQNVSSENKASFLEEVRLLKSELLEVSDLRLATLKSEISPESEARGSQEDRPNTVPEAQPTQHLQTHAYPIQQIQPAPPIQAPQTLSVPSMQQFQPQQAQLQYQLQPVHLPNQQMTQIQPWNQSTLFQAQPHGLQMFPPNPYQLAQLQIYQGRQQLNPVQLAHSQALLMPQLLQTQQLPIQTQHQPIQMY